MFYISYRLKYYYLKRIQQIIKFVIQDFIAL